jgi:hypothetical protein
MYELSGEALPIIRREGKSPRFWMVADGRPDALTDPTFRLAFDRAREELSRQGVKLKNFPHDWSLPEGH